MSLNQKIFALSWPIILSNISVPLLGLVDTAVLGHLSSADYLAAVALGASLFSFLFWGFGFLRMGTTGVVAQAAGQQNWAQVVRLLQQGIVLALAVASLLLMAQPWLIELGLALLTDNQGLQQLAGQYARVRIWAAPAVLINYVLLGWFLAQQNSRFSFYMLVLGNSVNIVLDLWFVLGLGWDVKGVALASLLADYLVLLVGGYLAWCHILCLQIDYPDKLRGQLRVSLGRFSDYQTLLKVNHQLLVRTWVLLFGMAFFTAQGARLGADVLAANAILLQMVMFVSYALDGLAHSAEALVGQSTGAKRIDELKAIVSRSLLLSLLAAGFFSVCYGLFGVSLASLMTDLPEVLLLVDQYLLWVVLIPIFAAASYLFDGVYIGLTRADVMRNTTVFATGLYLLVWYLSQGLGNQGLWFAFTLFALLRSLGLYWHYRWRLKFAE